MPAFHDLWSDFSHLLVWTMVIAYILGTLQWFLVGGGVGALAERFFEGLKTPDPEDEEWF